MSLNRGLGEAIKTGLTAAAHTADVIITCDADNSHDPIYMPAMVAELERTGKDLIIASASSAAASSAACPTSAAS